MTQIDNTELLLSNGPENGGVVRLHLNPKYDLANPQVQKQPKFTTGKFMQLGQVMKFNHINYIMRLEHSSIATD